MESYGEILKNTRLSKGIELETVARETSITQEYLEAIENEESGCFPGEPYFVGFLKNYADYLEIDTSHVLALYNAKKIQETPPPLALTAREKPKFLIPLIISVCAVILLAGGIIGTLYLKTKLDEKKEESNYAHGTEFKKYELTEKPFSGRLFKSDQLVMGSDKGNIFLTVAETEGIFALETPAGIQYVEFQKNWNLM